MRTLVLTVLLLAAPVLGRAHPAFVPTLPATALVQADPGRTTFAWTCGPAGWTASLARSVTGWLDVAAVATSQETFDLRLRTLLPVDLFPLRLSAELGWREVTAFGALHLGPIRFVAERRWGTEELRSLSLWAARPGLTIAVGAKGRDLFAPLVSVSWLPEVAPLWSLSLAVTQRGAQFGIGGTW